MRLSLLALLLVCPMAQATPSDLLVRLDRVQIDQMGQTRWQTQCRQGNSPARCAARLGKALALPKSDIRPLDVFLPTSERTVSRYPGM